MLVLDVDVGNTRIKCRLSQESCVIHEIIRPSCLEGMAQVVKRVNEELTKPLKRCRLSCVKSAQSLAKVVQILEQGLNVQVEVPLVANGIGGLNVAGYNPKKLGCDRWLAMLSAREKYPSKKLLVVDCGTAMTLDKVNSEGLFEGGFIVPGVQVMLKSLSGSADLIKLPNETKFSREMAKKTAECLQNGVASMLVSFLEKEYEQEAEEVSMIVTGGDAVIVENLIKTPVYHEANLVLDGLAVALP